MATEPVVATVNHDSTVGCIRLLPQGPNEPADLNGQITLKKFYCLAESVDGTDEVLSFNELTVVARGGQIRSTHTEGITGYRFPGKVTDMQVWEDHQGTALLAAGSSDGGVVMIALGVGRTPGSGAQTAAMQDMGCLDPEDASSLRPQFDRLHTGPVASIDIQQSTRAILTVGADGNVFVIDRAAQDRACSSGDDDDIRVLPFCTSTAGCASYSNGRWIDTNCFATVSVLGGLQVWDLRSAPKPVYTSPASWGSVVHGNAQHPMAATPYCTWLHAHPSRPDVVATGSTTGQVALWDLKHSKQPLMVSVSDEGQVWQLQFDRFQYGVATSTNSPGVLYCSEEGAIGNVVFSESGSVGGRATILHQSPHAVNSFDTGGQYGEEIIATTDGQQIVYVNRRL